ncbi:MAG: DNA-processing protein DprA [Clostridia bacterium]|nr:DNA-processing protein DprA [Clostridia bacterium]
MLDSSLLKNLLVLQKAFGYGSTKAYKVYEKLKANDNLCKNERIISKALSEAERIKFEKVDNDYADKVLKDCKKENVNIITIESENYPERLRNIPSPPLVLFYRGKFPEVDREPAFCIVGPRKVTEFGAKSAYSLSARLSRAGFIIVSGGALGCDSFAHKGALKYGGKTIAVLGCGIGNNYLLENEKLRCEIEESCCIISEYPPYTPASKFTFPVRNRLMSGLSLGVAVIEAGEHSGALITAKHAAEQGRDVFVIPGNPTLKCYKGSNALLRDGAKPLLDASDVFGEYIYQFADKIDIAKAFEKVQSKEKIEKNQKNFIKTLSNEAKIVYNYLDKQKFTADDLLGTGLDDTEVLSALTELEMEGIIKAQPGGAYILAE